MTRTMRAVIAAAIAALVGGCSEPTTISADSLTAAAAKVGADRVLSIALSSATAGDAGMLFTVEGPNILDVVPGAGYSIVKSENDSRGRSSVNVLVIGPLQSGIVAYAMVKGNSANPFRATVDQVAAGASGGYAQRTDFSSYQLTVSAQR